MTEVTSQINPKIKDTYETLINNVKVKEALEFIKSENENTVQDQMDITSIPAPTFQEGIRGNDYKKRLKDLGIEDLKTDEAGNVFGIRKGEGDGPTLFVSAHLDTVFPEGTDTNPVIKDGKIYAPGISDDGRGLAVVLTIIKALNRANIQTKGDIIFGATVGEEGLGDLRGVKHYFQTNHHIDGFISVEPGEPNRITYLGTGSKRYSITFNGPGGHSFGHFGLPSAIHAMGRAIAKIADIQTPEIPKTTFNVGVTSGGTTVNTIAAEANMIIDLRSTDQEELIRLEDNALTLIQEAIQEENNRSHLEDESQQITMKAELVGDRPAGSQSSDLAIVQSSLAATELLGFEAELGAPMSTDSNVPISLGIPAVTLGGGGDIGGIHTLNEYFDPTNAFYGIQNIFLIILGLVGVEEMTDSIL